ncbi:MAG: ABC transporter permease [Defluviitaleaceae bacterium]|nr:ABC transporter permease [Defluviitaleaceae bacterium]
MKSFHSAYRNELTKLFLRKKYIVFLVIGLIICIGWAALAFVAAGLMNRSAGMFFNLTPTPMGALPIFLQFILPLLIFMGATDLITSEGSDGTMKGSIFCPVEKWKLYTAKIAAIMVYVIIYLTCIYAISTILNQTMGNALDAGQLFNAFMSYLLALPPLLVLATFAAFVALLVRSSTLVMLLLIGSYLLLNVLPLFSPIFSELIFTSYLGWHRLWVGILPGASRLAHMVVILLSYGAVFYIAGSLIFDRKEY